MIQRPGKFPRPFRMPLPVYQANTHAHAAQRTERPRDPAGVAAFMSAHSKPPYITHGMDISSGKGVVRGRRVQQLTFAF